MTRTNNHENHQSHDWLFSSGFFWLALSIFPESACEGFFVKKQSL